MSNAAPKVPTGRFQAFETARHGDHPVRFTQIGDSGPCLVTHTLGSDRGLYIPAVLDDIAARARLLVVKWPDVGRLGDAIDVSAAAMEACGFDHAVWHGSSVGGALAQCAALKQPHRVAALILANTAAPVRWAAPLVGLAGALVGLMPPALLRRRMAQSLGLDSDNPEAEKYLELLTKTDLQNWLRWAAQFHRTRLHRNDIDPARPVLILESDDDPGVPASHRARLKRLYKHADSVCFPGGGHFPQIAYRGAYAGSICAFLDKIETRA